MLIKNKLILFIIFFTFSLTISSQTYFHKEFLVTNGLSQSQVASLFQDNKGNIWIGTNGGGINIYNGHDFTNLTKDDGMAGNIIYSINQDSDNNIIIGTDNGLSIYNGFTFKNYTTNDGLPHNRVWSTVLDKDGKIWIGTEQGVAILDKNKIKNFNENKILSSACVWNMIIDKEHRIWFGTRSTGLILYNKNKFQVFTVKDSLCSNHVKAIVQDKDGNIWIGTNKGLNIFKGNKLLIYAKLKTFFYSGFLSKTGEVCLLSTNGNIVKYDFNKGITEKYKFADKQITSGIEDREGNMWVGTYTGLIKFPPNIFCNWNKADGLLNNNIYSVSGTKDGCIWFGSSNEGSTKLENNNNLINYPATKDSKGIIGGSVISILEDNNNNIWFGTYLGLSIFNTKDSAFYNYTNTKKIKEPSKIKIDKKNNIKTVLKVDTNITHDYINSIIQDKNGVIWIGTQNGITRFYNNKFENFNSKFPELKGKVIFKIFENKTLPIILCFATDKGAYFYDGKSMMHLNKKNGFVDDIVVSIEQDKRGNYWFGTKEGVYRWDSYNFEKIDKSKGLSSNNIYLIIMDDNDNLFIGTDKGIDKLNTKAYNKNKEILIRKYGNVEGFVGQECNRNACYKDKTGKIWFGTVDGVNVYNPKNDVINTVKPQTYISDIQLDFKVLNYSEYSDGVDSITKLPIGLSLPYNKNHLTFTFYSTSYSIPEKVKYQYMLEPLATDWSPPLLKSEIDFPILPPGSYTFKVRSCNNDGIWNETPTTFSFVIKPPFWLTWWGITLEIIIGIIVIYFYIKFREASLVKEKKILEQKVEERTIEIREQKELVEEINKDITDSINYAKNIQEAILPHLEDFENRFPESFILFKPRDIVSGDFYWLANKYEQTFVAVADCTGHGVPGAFMSMLGIAFLNEIINLNEKIDVGSILDKLRENVIKSLHQTGESGKSKDGMDITLCAIDWKDKQIHFSGANNPLYIIRNKEVIEYKASKMPIGYGVRMDNFEKTVIDIEYNDSIFLFTDGYADQFGGPKGKKFKYSQLKELLININDTPMNEQKTILNDTIDEWKKNDFQVDDILMIGIKFNHPCFKENDLDCES